MAQNIFYRVKIVMTFKIEITFCFLIWYHYFFRIQKQRSITVAYIFPDLEANISSILTTDEDLHVFIPNDSNLDISIDRFIQLYSLRTRTNREFWLFDASYWSSISDTVNILKDLPIDLGNIHKLTAIIWGEIENNQYYFKKYYFT